MDKLIELKQFFFSDDIKNTTIYDFLHNNQKALIIKGEQGVWYYYKYKLVRIHKNIFNDYVYLHSYLCIRHDDHHVIFYMENGSSITLSYTNNQIILYLPDDCRINYNDYQLIQPLTVDELKNYTL